jgi:Flp pilus assembly protein TadG
MKLLKDLLRCTRATAAVEAAIFAPIFLILTLGVTDVGMQAFVRMSVNAATQAGALYAVVNSGKGKACEITTATPAAWVNQSSCVAAIKAVINDATGDPSFCTGTVCGTPSIGACDDLASATCITVSTSYPYSPLLPDAAYSWAQSTTVTSTSTVRIL